MSKAGVPAVLLAVALIAAAPSAMSPVAAPEPPARSAPPTSISWSVDRWRAPVDPLVVLRRFDPPEQPWLPGHRGVDLRSRTGGTVRAAGAGRVTFAADLAGRGVVVVDHGTLRTTYEPVDAAVGVGQRVTAGEVIGAVGTGAGHCGSGDCVHLGLRRGRTYLDPLLILGRAVTRLRPW